MKNITFISQISSVEFASKWREKLFPEQIQVGRDYAKKKAQKLKLTSKDRNSIDDVKIQAAKARKSLKINKRENFTVSPGFNAKRKIYDYEKEKIQLLKNKKTPNNTPPIKNSKVVAPNLNETFSKTSDIKVNIKSNTPLLQAKKLPIGKIGLGAVGLATLGAVGYGLTRKIRSDKGKKRK